MNAADPCAPLWKLVDWMTVDAAAAMWCAGDEKCEVARRAAILSAVERGDIEARDCESWGDNPAQLIASGRAGRVLVSRASLAMWADSLPIEMQPRSVAIKERVRMDTSHLRALDTLAKAAGIDFAVHGSAARLREKTELAGLAITADAAEGIAKRIRSLRESEWE